MIGEHPPDIPEQLVWSNNPALRRLGKKLGLPDQAPHELIIRILAEKGGLDGIRDECKLQTEKLIRIKFGARQANRELPPDLFCDDDRINRSLLDLVFRDYRRLSDFDRYLRHQLGVAEDAPLELFLRATGRQREKDPFTIYHQDLLWRLTTIKRELAGQGERLPENIGWYGPVLD